MLGPASVVIAIVPMVISSTFTISLLDGSIKFSLFALWAASVSFVLSLVMLHFGCPKFIKEYRDFGQYKQRQHSHRWIVWLFYHNLKKLSGWEKIVQETLPKDIAHEPTTSIEADICKKHPDFEQLPDKDRIQPFEPVNVGRDIYLPIHCNGKKLVISMKEADAKLDHKEKELFWILYSAAAKEHLAWRIFFWGFIYLSAIFVSINVAKNICLGVDYLCTNFIPHIFS